MLAAFALSILAATGHHAAKPYTDRVDFDARLGRTGGMTRSQVKKLLGQPGSIRSYDQGFPAEAWCYGCQGPDELPLLGVVVFDRKHIAENLNVPGFEGLRTSTPPMSVIGDQELFHYLRTLDSARPNREFGGYWRDAQFLAAASNSLTPLGKAKALAVIEEFQRLACANEADTMYELIALMFVCKKPGLDNIYGGGGASGGPGEFKFLPNYPILSSDGVPFTIESLHGASVVILQTLQWFVRDHQRDWQLRPKAERPTDDLFTALEHLMKGPIWAKMRHTSAENVDRVQTPWMIWDVLESVRAVVPPPKADDVYNLTLADLAKAHAKYLARGGHWDPVKLRYVGRRSL